MFYKDGVLSTEQKAQFKDSPEFALALFDRVSFISDYSLALLQGSDERGNLLFNIPVVSFGKNQYYLSVRGARTACHFNQRSYAEKYKNLHDFQLKPVTQNEFHTIFQNIDPNKLKEAKKIVSDFHHLESKQEVTDKFGKVYELTIISNEDTSIGDVLIVDTAYLIDKETKKEVGYLKTKYTTPAILQKLNAQNGNDLFNNVATIDFSNLEDEYLNRGLGYVMYFHMAQHFQKKQLEFRQSTLQSPDAERLWNGIKNHMKEFVSFKTFHNKPNTAFLSIGENFLLNFLDEKPVIKSKITY